MEKTVILQQPSNENLNDNIPWIEKYRPLKI